MRLLGENNNFLFYSRASKWRDVAYVDGSGFKGGVVSMPTNISSRAACAKRTNSSLSCDKNCSSSTRPGEEPPSGRSQEKESCPPRRRHPPSHKTLLPLSGQKLQVSAKKRSCYHSAVFVGVRMSEDAAS